MLVKLALENKLYIRGGQLKSLVLHTNNSVLMQEVYLCGIHFLLK